MRKIEAVSRYSKPTIHLGLTIVAITIPKTQMRLRKL